MDLSPVFISVFSLGLVMFLGLMSRKTNILTSDNKRVLSSYIYYFALPALFFTEIMRTDFAQLEKKVLIGSLLPLVIVCTFLIVLYVLKLIRKDHFIIASLCIVFGSNAFFGIAFFETLLGEWGFHISVVTASFLGIVGIVSSQLLFEYAIQEGRTRVTLIRVLRSPLIISIVVALCFSFLRVQIAFLGKALALLGRTAAGCAIFLLGMFIYDNFSKQVMKQAVLYSLVRIVALPLAMFISFLFLGEISIDLKKFLLLQSGIPAAITIAVFADRYNYKAAILSGAVVLTSLMSFMTLSILYWLAS